MKVLVTGGAGYIGSHVVAELIARGHETVVFDNLYQGHRAAVHESATFIQGDLADRSLVNELFAAHSPEAVMHFASYTLVGESMAKPFLYLRDNVVNGLNLIEAAVDHDVRRFVLSSTANLFDDPDEMPITEGAAIRPGSPYGESKYILERILYWMAQTRGLRYTAFRYFNACGAGGDLGEDHDPETHLIPLVLQVALGHRPHIEIYGADYDTPDGTCIRDYIHVLDLADAHIRALDFMATRSGTFNLGNGQGFSVREVIATAREVTGQPIPAVEGPRRPGDPAVLVAASDRAREALGWRPQYDDLREIVASAWRWFQANPRGYDPA